MKKQEFIAINKKLILDMDDIIDIKENIPDKNYTLILPYDDEKQYVVNNVFITKESYKAFKKRLEKKNSQLKKRKE